MDNQTSRDVYNIIEGEKNTPRKKMKRPTAHTSTMQIGDYGIYNGDVVRLRDGGTAGGCQTDLYLAYQYTVGDVYDGQLGNPASAELPHIIIDSGVTA